MRNILAVMIGIFAGAIVNGAIIKVGSSLIPLPNGIDPNNFESLKAAIPNFEPNQFLFPFLAHSIGTLVGAFITSLVSSSNKLYLALLIGFVFFVGGIYMISILPSPIWFSVLDAVGSYFPMAWIGYWLVNKYFKNRSAKQ
jgi:hypothetical protein